MEYGIIFDLDGTLIDTERFAKECWDKALNDFKLNIPSDFREHLISVDMKFVEQEMKRVLPEEITKECGLLFLCYVKSERIATKKRCHRITQSSERREGAISTGNYFNQTQTEML